MAKQLTNEENEPSGKKVIAGDKKIWKRASFRDENVFPSALFVPKHKYFSSASILWMEKLERANWNENFQLAVRNKTSQAALGGNVL